MNKTIALLALSIWQSVIMNPKILLSIVLFSLGFRGNCTTYTITNNGMSFIPASIIIVLGDTIQFVIDGTHNVVEVSYSTWNANGNSPLAGGFQVPFGGGLLLPSQIYGLHYYVCSPHAQNAMKGEIIVLHHAGIAENLVQANISAYPNPTNDFINIVSTENKNFSLYIFNTLGEKIYSENSYPLSIGEGSGVRFQSANHPNGIYYIHVYTQNKFYSQKFVKQ